MNKLGGFVSMSRTLDYGCKICGRPVERAIEGELICPRCWTEQQMDEDGIACDAAIREYEQEEREEQKCPDCGRHSVVIGYEECVEDVKMECPYCGIWWLWSKDAGNDRYRKYGVIL